MDNDFYGNADTSAFDNEELAIWKASTAMAEALHIGRGSWDAGEIIADIEDTKPLIEALIKLMRQSHHNPPRIH